MQIKGKHNTASILGDSDYPTLTQIRRLCDMPALAGQRMCFMPDNCPGIVAPIGTVMTYGETLLPILVSADIGCGVLSVQMQESITDWAPIDALVRARILHHEGAGAVLDRHRGSVHLDDLLCKKALDMGAVYASMGTLGGGNHFLEGEVDGQGRTCITIHSGSRLLGGQVFQYYMDEGYRAQGDRSLDRDLTALTGDLLGAYLHDAAWVQSYARGSRLCMAELLADGCGIPIARAVDSVHNYVDPDSRILRKGAIAAPQGAEVVMPVSARQGVLRGRGLGNPDYLASAPHGAGRIMSRGQAKQRWTLEEFQAQMQGVYSTAVTEANLSECPGVYRDMETMLQQIDGVCVEVTDILTPVYSFKQS